MTDLVRVAAHLIDGALKKYDSGPLLTLSLYCWRCDKAHEMTLEGVEQMIYALGAAEQDAYAVGADAGSKLANELKDVPACWLSMLENANDIEMYAEHVEQGVERRKAL